MVCRGSNTLEEPMVYVQEIMPDSDCHRDGQLHPEDQLIAINRDSRVGSTNEEAKGVLTKNQFRHENSTEVTFIPGRGQLSSTPTQNNLHLSSQKPLGNGLAPSRLKVYVRPPECRQEIHFPAPCPSPDICRPEVTVSGPTSPGFQTTAASQTKVNLDPHIRLKEEKLELVLQYLGLDVSEGKRRELRHCLVPDLQGTVTFGDVVQVFREILQDDLEEAGLDETSFLFTHHQVATLLDTSTFHSSTFESFNYTESSIAQHRNQEVSDLQQEIYRLKVRLKDAESRKEVMEEELQKLNQEILVLKSENHTMQHYLQEAEIEQHRAHSAEHDYEEAVHLLEVEITELKSKLAEKRATAAPESRQTGSPDVKCKLSLMDDQLRRTEISHKRLEMSNKKLLCFVQNVHMLLTKPYPTDDEQSSACKQQEDSNSSAGLFLPSSELIEMLVSEASKMLHINDDSTPGWENVITGKEDGPLNSGDHTQQKSLCSSTLCSVPIFGRRDEIIMTKEAPSRLT